MSLEITKELIKEAVTQRPDYRALCDQTREGLATYFEGEALRRQIVQYPKEDQEKFAWRRERMLDSYDNYVKEIAESYIEGVFRTKHPVRKVPNVALQEYLMGEYADWFLQDFTPFALFLPELYVVCDNPKPEGEIYSQKDRDELQGVPFPSLYFPQYCCNMGYNVDKSLSWVSFYYDAPPAFSGKDSTNTSPNSAQPTEGAKNNETWYKLYTDSYWAVFNQDGEFMPMPQADGTMLSGPQPHDFGFLPVVRVAWRANLSAQDSMRAGYAFMHSIVKITLGGLTAKGVLHDFQFYSLFPKLTMDEATADTVVETGTGANIPIVVPSQKDGTGAIKEGMKPFYLEVPLREFEALERIAYERIPTAAYRAARLRDRQSIKTRTGTEQSGISKMFDMVPELGVLKAVAKFLRRSDLDICKMLARLADTDQDRVEIEYPTTFDTKSVTEMMAENVQFGQSMKQTSMPTSKTGTILLSQRAWNAMLPDIPDKVKAQIDKEIEDALQEPTITDDEDIVDETLTDSEASAPLAVGQSAEFPSGKP